MIKIRKGRGYVYAIQYHLVWCVKYRKPLLYGEVERRLKEMLKEQSEVHKFEIVEMETDKDHIHLLIDCSPQHYLPNIMKALKGNTARFLFKEFPELKKELWGGHLWNPSYFVCTVSDRTEEQIKAYIQNQPTKKRKRGRPMGV
ncbi:IS200/IS605 family transposase [Bacillus thermotolerans]|uniref:IS200/IS605 family transposase n=1 Tax=Bacillus thermotolerans TaxID=1221996 RepID=UPI000616F019|nr:IS200/IS605 family transposase [Bacillus thermotolerans]